MKRIGLIVVFVIVIILAISYFSFIINGNNNDQNDKIISDKDGDDIEDENDDFPDDPSASLDTDKDGYPDRWNEGKNEQDSTSNLLLDSFPYDPSASVDTDGDGFPNYWNDGKNKGDSTSIPPLELDEFPDDSKAHVDTDKDGYADFYDINDDVNLSITLEIKKFELTDKVDFLSWGQIYIEVSIGKKNEELKNNGRGWWVWVNQVVNINKKIEYDIPDGTDERYTEISISMYDLDFLSDDDKVDINSDENKESISLKFDNEQNKIDYENVNYGSKATIWYEISYLDIDDEESEDIYEKTYTWEYKNKDYTLDLEIPIETYQYYLESDVYRAPQSTFDSSNSMKNFVTSNEKVIEDLSNKLKSLSNEEKFNDKEEVNFILKFVQNIPYAFDNDTKGRVEYWRFPVETLTEEVGDCEDTSVLYASILDNLGYDTALLFYSWQEDDMVVGHISVGINLKGLTGDYVRDKSGVKYYYCETTNRLNVGEKPNYPPNLQDDPYKIIHI